MGKEGLDALRGAALADFDPAAQLWRWHATVTDYARARWPLTEEERRGRLAATLPAWTRWLERLEAKTPETAARLEDQRPNLEALLDPGVHRAYDQARGWFQALHRALPAPDRTLALRDFEAAVYRAWADAAGRADAVEDRAIALGMTGCALSALGRREEALQATQEAVAHYRELALKNPSAFRPDLARSLNNLGAMLSELGRREEALQATQEAVAHYRELARANPPAFRPDLAMSLTGLGVHLAALGRREEALQATQEAVDLYRELARANPPAFRPDLARSLGAHGTVLRGLGRPGEAARAFAEGLRTIFPFVQALPAAFGELADALLQEYLQACREAKREPDRGLVEEVRRVAHVR